MTDWTKARAPSLDDFAALAEAALRALPEPFRAMASEARMQVADFPDEELLDSLELDDPFSLTGVYSGSDLTRRSVLDAGGMPPEILLFRRPILDEWAEHGAVALGELITHVLVHEIGHHFGLSDDDIEAAERR